MSGLALIVCLALVGIAVWAIVKSGGRSAYQPIDRMAPTLPPPAAATGSAFCASCGAPLASGAAFCADCGARAEAGAAPPSPALPTAAAAPDPVAAAAPQAQPAMPPASPAAQASGDPMSLDVQPGETLVGSWTVNIDRGRLLTGKLTITDQRLIFRPQAGGVGVIGIIQSQGKRYKDAHTIILGRDHIVSVHTEKSLLKKNVHVTAANGVVYVFGCSPWNIDEVAQALQRR